MSVNTFVAGKNTFVDNQARAWAAAHPTWQVRHTMRWVAGACHRAFVSVMNVRGADVVMECVSGEGRYGLVR
jgi:hypothetical protein